MLILLLAKEKNSLRHANQVRFKVEKVLLSQVTVRNFA